MVKEALQALDSRKGVSSQAIQSYIKEKYPSVDLVRLNLVRNSLKKGIETGTLVRPANASVTTGAMGKFRLAPKVKDLKPKSENTDPNVKRVPKAAKDGEKKPKKAVAPKKKNPANEEALPSEMLCFSVSGGGCTPRPVGILEWAVPAQCSTHGIRQTME